MSDTHFNATTNRAVNEDGTVVAPGGTNIVYYTYNLPSNTNATGGTGDATVEGGAMAQVGSAQVSFTLAEDSLCLILYNGSATTATALTELATAGYQINSDTAVVVLRTDQSNAAAPHNNISFCVPLVIPSGSHTVKLMGGRSSGTFTFIGPQFYNLGQFAVVVLGPV